MFLLSDLPAAPSMATAAASCTHTQRCMCFDKQQLRWQALDQSVEPCCAARVSTGSGGGAVGGKGGSLRVDRRAVVTVSLCGCRRRPPLLSACSLTSMTAAGSTCTDTAARALAAAAGSSCLDQSGSGMCCTSFDRQCRQRHRRQPHLTVHIF